MKEIFLLEAFLAIDNKVKTLSFFIFSIKLLSFYYPIILLPKLIKGVFKREILFLIKILWTLKRGHRGPCFGLWVISWKRHSQVMVDTDIFCLELILRIFRFTNFIYETIFKVERCSAIFHRLLVTANKVRREFLKNWIKQSHISNLICWTKSTCKKVLSRCQCGKTGRFEFNVSSVLANVVNHLGRTDQEPTPQKIRNKQAVDNTSIKRINN